MDDLSYELLELFSIRGPLSTIEIAAILNQDFIELADVIFHLLKNDYIYSECCHLTMNNIEEVGITPTEPFSITFQGKQALELENKNRKHFKYNEFRAWTTLAIAIAAFVKSFFF